VLLRHANVVENFCFLCLLLALLPVRTVRQTFLWPVRDHRMLASNRLWPGLLSMQHASSMCAARFFFLNFILLFISLGLLL
jgi:hypothetical protein